VSALEDGTDRPPLLRLVRGDAAPEELAAVLTLLAARASGGHAEPAGRAGVPGWVDRAGAIGATSRPGPGAWQHSGRPH
jgi:hypothetical protein